MQAKKFGTFAGVFTPSLLTILGVIMYMRLGWVVGVAGLYAALGIIMLAHLISITTGLSIASIATDKKIASGGIYYILSRSLGLPIGGAIGIVLFIGTSLSISLYLVGFSENFLGIEAISQFTGLSANIDSIRIVGSVVILLLVILAFISTSLAIKAQFIILTAIALSLLSIFLGLMSPGENGTAETHLFPVSGHLPFEAIFAIFFPAVTGFTAGVAMSGDLKNPKKSIPGGTLAAILVGLLVYVGLSIGLAMAVDRDMLISDPNFLMRIAWSAPLVIAGIWGATLSSALGGILGAPRILQAMSADRITPKIFSLRQGINNEPRNALLLTYLIAEAGILIGDLNIIARIVSMFYIAAYGFINLSLALESWASSDFRPSFRIRPIIGLIGFTASFGVMFKIDILAMLIALAVMSFLYLFLARKAYRLDLGDVWQSVYTSIARSSLHRLDQHKMEERNWRPNTLAFSRGTSAQAYLMEFGIWLTGRHGFLSHFDLIETPEADRLFPKHQQSLQTDRTRLHKGVFERKQHCRNLNEGILTISQTYGFAGIEPNTVLLEWPRPEKDPVKFVQLLQQLTTLDYNLLLMDYEPRSGFGKKQRIDIWWRGGGQNGNLSLSLVRQLALSNQWRRSTVRLLIVNPVNHQQELLRQHAREVLETMRMEAEILVINNEIEKKSLYEIIRAESTQTDLIFFGLTDIPDENATAFLEETNALLKDIGTVVMVKASSTFKELRIGYSESAVIPLSENLIEMQTPTQGAVGSDRIPLEVETKLQDLREHTDQFLKQIMLPLLQQEGEDIAVLVKQTCEMLDKLSEESGKGSLEAIAFIRSQKAISFRFRKLINKIRKRDQDDHKTFLQKTVNEWLTLAGRIKEDVIDSFSIKIPVSRLYEPQEKVRGLRFFLLRNRMFYGNRKIYPYRIQFKKLISSRYPGRQQQFVQQLVRIHQQYRANLFQELKSHHLHLTDGLLAMQLLAGEEKQDRLAILERIAKLKETLKSLDSLVAKSTKTFEKAGSVFLTNETKYYNELFNKAAPNLYIKKHKSSHTQFDDGGLISQWFSNQDVLTQTVLLEINLKIYARRIREIVIEFRGKKDEYISQEYEFYVRQIAGILEEVHNQGLTEAAQNLIGLDVQRSTEAKPENVIKEIFRDGLEKMKSAAGIFPTSITLLDKDGIALMLQSPLQASRSQAIKLRQIIDRILATEAVQPMENQAGWLGESLGQVRSELSRVLRLLFFLAENVSSSLITEDEFRKTVSEQHRFVLSLGKKIQKYREESFYRTEERLNALSQALTTDTILMLAGKTGRITRAERKGTYFAPLLAALHNGRGTLLARLSSSWYGISRFLLLGKKDPFRTQTRLELKHAVRQELSPLLGNEEVKKKLSFYYLQLFSRRNLYIQDFFTGRESILQQSQPIVKAFKSGKSPIICLTGMPGCGSSFTALAIAQQHFPTHQTYHLKPPAGGSLDPAVFRKEVQRLFSGDLTSVENTAQFQKESVLIIDNLELWWEKSPKGYRVLDSINKLLQQEKGRVLPILVCNKFALRLISQTHSIMFKVDHFLEVPLMSAKEIEMAIMQRHETLGQSIHFSSKGGEHILLWKKARLFSRLFNLSGGIIASALMIWPGLIDDVDDKSLRISRRQIPDASVLDGLRPVENEMLSLFNIHRMLDNKRLSRLLGITTEDATDLLNHFEDMLLLQRKDLGFYEIHPLSMPIIIRHLQGKSLI